MNFWLQNCLLKIGELPKTKYRFSKVKGQKSKLNRSKVKIAYSFLGNKTGKRIYFLPLITLITRIFLIANYLYLVLSAKSAKSAAKFVFNFYQPKENKSIYFAKSSIELKISTVDKNNFAIFIALDS
jgi:hypothetical protein